MEEKQIILGFLTAAFVFGAYFIGLFQGQRHPNRWREFFQSMTRSLTLRGLLWAVSLPAAWVILYYAFVAHVWLSLGRWPEFGEELGGWLVKLHGQTLAYLLLALIASLWIALVVLVVFLFWRRRRHVSVYAATYSAAVGIACCIVFLAPNPFLNWLFD